MKNRSPFARFTSYDIGNDLTNAFYFNGLWSHDRSALAAMRADQSLPLDGTGTVPFYKWDFGDGSPPATGPFLVYVFPSSGTYDVTLTVGDEACELASVTTEIAVP